MNFDGIEFYILCYNSLFCCDYQIKCINQFCKDKFKIIIFDSNLGTNPIDSKQKELLCKEKNVEFIGVGGPSMKQQGLKSFFDYSNLSLYGVFQVIPNIN